MNVQDFLDNPAEYTRGPSQRGNQSVVISDYIGSFDGNRGRFGGSVVGPNIINDTTSIASISFPPTLKEITPNTLKDPKHTSVLGKFRTQLEKQTR